MEKELVLIVIDEGKARFIPGPENSLKTTVQFRTEQEAIEAQKAFDDLDGSDTNPIYLNDGQKALIYSMNRVGEMVTVFLKPLDNNPKNPMT